MSIANKQESRALLQSIIGYFKRTLDISLVSCGKLESILKQIEIATPSKNMDCYLIIIAS